MSEGAGGAVAPYPMGDATDIKEVMNKVQQMLDELYQDRIGGAMLGDVFQVGNDEVMTLNLASNGGLTKISSALSIMIQANQGLALGDGGLAVQIKPSGGLSVGATGLYVTSTEPVIFKTIIDETANRVAGTQYTNSQTVPMELCITISLPIGSGATLIVNGITCISIPVNTVPMTLVLTKIVPIGKTYQLNQLNSTLFTIKNWIETY
jgi:hypothetical protein